MFFKKYELTNEVLGVGEFGKVVKAKRLYSKLNWEKTNSHEESFVAVKAISKKRLDKDIIHIIDDEMKVLNTLDHPNIIKYYEEF